MKKKKIKLKKGAPLKKFMRGNIVIPLLIGVVIIFGVMLTSGSMVNKSATDPNATYGEAEVAPDTAKQNLQLKTVTFKAKPTPKGDSCNHDMFEPAYLATCQCVAWLVKCENNKCVDVNVEKSGMTGTKEEVCSQFDQNNWCGIFSKGGNGWYCIGKPVIYLYPEETTLVDVGVTTAGKVVISDPQIEDWGGWKRVLAHPSGQLEYRGNVYRELFYETASQDVEKPEAGIVISRRNLENGLLSFITKLGLTRHDEQQEFLDWWVPRLKALNSPYIFASILEQDEKLRLDKITINPKPDTMIEFIAYFKPLDNPFGIKPLILPETPERKGFTAIEWGGVIGR